MSNRKLSAKDIQAGTKFFIGSLLAEALIFAPRKTIKVGEKELTIQGLFPMMQGQIASGAEKVLNTFMPDAVDKGVDALLSTKLEPLLRDKTTWFLYDYLEQFSLNSVLQKLFEQSSLLEKNKFSNALRSYLTGVLQNRDNRDDFVDSLSKGVVNALGILADGSILSILMNDNITDAIKDTVSAVVDQAVSSKGGESVVQQLLGVVSQMEEITVGSFLTDHVGISRDQMGQKIDDLYDQYLGKTMVENLRKKNLGGQVYADLINMEYDTFFKNLINNHLYDLIRVAIGAASIGLFLKDKDDDFSTRVQKAKSFSSEAKGFGKRSRKPRRKNNKATKRHRRSGALTVS